MTNNRASIFSLIWPHDTRGKSFIISKVNILFHLVVRKKLEMDLVLMSGSLNVSKKSIKMPKGYAETVGLGQSTIDQVRIVMSRPH
jgi:hypothetical protein